MKQMEQSLSRRVHRNLMDVNVLGAVGSGGMVHGENGGLFFASRSDAQFLNGVMREAPEGDAADLLARARSFFFERGRGFVVFAWPGDPQLEEAALSAGMFPVRDRYPEMICRSRLPELPGDVRPVADLEDAAAYWQICDEAYSSIGLPPGLFSETFQPQLLLDQDHVWACLARLEGRPVACASLWLTSGDESEVGFLGWVAALPSVRGRGLAAACTVSATNRAFDLGADVASLQASPMGEHVYRDLGYEELFAYRLMGAMPPG